MGCASSQAIESNNSKAISDMPTAPVSANSEERPNKYPPAEAFEIRLDGDQPISIISSNDNNMEMSSSIIKKHPPKRLQRLIEQSSDNSLTPSIEDLTEKLAKAEVRRQKFLQQKVDTVLALAQSNKESNDAERSPGDGDEEINKQNEKLEK